MAIAVIQTTATPGRTASATTLGVTFASTPTAGNAVIVYVWGHSPAALTSPAVTDNKGNGTYTKFLSEDATHGGYCAIFHKLNIASGATFTVTFSYTGTAGPIEIVAQEVNGLKNTGQPDQLASSGAVSSSPAATSVTTTVADEYLAMVFSADDTHNPCSVTTPTGATLVQDETDGATYHVGGGSYQIVSSTGSYNPTWGLGFSCNWLALIQTYIAEQTPTSFSFGSATDGAGPGLALTTDIPANSTVDAVTGGDSVAPKTSFTTTAPDASDFIALSATADVSPSANLSSVIALSSGVALAGLSSVALEAATAVTAPASSAFAAAAAVQQAAPRATAIIVMAGSTTLRVRAGLAKVGAEDTFTTGLPPSSSFLATAGLREDASKVKATPALPPTATVATTMALRSVGGVGTFAAVHPTNSVIRAGNATRGIGVAFTGNAIAPVASTIQVQMVSGADGGIAGDIVAPPVIHLVIQVGGDVAGMGAASGAAPPPSSSFVVRAVASSDGADVLVTAVSMVPDVVFRRSFLGERTGSRGHE